MKLSGIYKDVATRVTTGIAEDKLIDYINTIIREGTYKNLSTRIASGVRMATFSPAEVCKWYDKYNCNDNHITTLFKKVIKENYPKAWRIIEENGR